MKYCCRFIALIVFLSASTFILLEATPSRLTERVCLGTDNGMSISGDSAIRYSRYKNRYSNCTYVDGNLELKFLDGDQDYDLNFLKDIRIVTGYVLIVSIYARYIPLHSLQIIRGSDNFEWTDGSFCSLCVIMNHKPNDSDIGLRELQMPALTEISNGNVVIYKNNFLCFIDTIAWTLIVPRTSQVAVVYHETEKAKCYGCIHGCHKLRTDTISCWGLGIDMCQTQNNGSACSSSCAYRCFGPTSSQCCHSECAGGCTGPTNRDCYACRHMNDDGACVENCPSIRSNRKRMRIHSGDQNKLTFQDICLRKCPAYTSRYGDTCVLSCPEGTSSIKTDQYSTNICEPCKKCPKECVFEEDFVHAGNIDMLKDCVVVRGHIAIVEATFKGDRYYNVPPMSPSKLDILMSIEEITHSLYISDTVPTITSLRMLRNLKIINGQKTLNGYALAVVFCKGLQSLNLNSLRHIYQGNVMIRKNPNLCYANTMNMSHIFSTSTQKTVIVDNKDRIACLNTGQVCDYQCKVFGCWGPDAEDCIDCINYRVERTGKCVPSCWNVTMVYEGEQNTCKSCHEECSGGCSGPGANQCHSCLNVKFKSSCIKKCPRKMIRNSKGICKSKKRGSRKDRKRKLSPRKKKKRTSKKIHRLH
ncbi:epidermal growth factor receptor-like isoform X2 [Octopus vulgaris]|uniref:receptor protein-tyrosine kinase n=1 Tax=Octopus vulgaris TaxID=6645 RepID=A0AA36F972_OCTVU|nr:epidermal growth factor receptor-like isoform X2 [Octopus vulgaris]